MPRDYNTEALSKFPLPLRPDEGNYGDHDEFELALAEYTVGRRAVLDRRARWIEAQQVEDKRRQAETERAKAAGEKRHRELVWSPKKRPREWSPGPSACERCNHRGGSDAFVGQSPGPCLPLIGRSLVRAQKGRPVLCLVS